MYNKQQLDLKVEKENRFFDIDKEVGECFTNIKDGYGLNVFKNGDRYIGFWEKNTMHGMGIYVFKTIEGANPIAYLGQFFYGKFHGLGKLVRMLD